MKKLPLTIAQAEIIPIAELLSQAHPALEAGGKATFRVALPCGCVRTYHLDTDGDDETMCVNATATDPKDIN